MQAEILAPAGNREALEAAFAAGADAVYLGLPLFGARAFAKNFSLEEVRQIIEQAHLAGKKIYITMNTLLEEEQMEKAYDWAKQLYEMGVDALIIQDLGLIHLLHHRLPGLELHASTQLSVLRPEQIRDLARLGIRRVVLAREATLDEIRACAATGMELEVFVHGALCISYSGQCQFSQVRYGRSGNKGACAQPCRMEYALLENGKPVQTVGSYLLSPRDLSILDKIPELEQAGVASLKIEGRMKSPSYVYESVMKARKARSGKKLDAQDKKDLMLTFNRGYTQGHAFEKKGMDLMNPLTSNHQGIVIGKVLAIKGKRILMQLDQPLHQNDGIRFENRQGGTGCRVNFLYDEQGKLTSSVPAGSKAEIPFLPGVYPGEVIRKTVDSQMEKEVENAVKQTRVQSGIRFRVSNEGVGKPVVLQATDGRHEVRVEGPIAQQALRRPVDAEDFDKQLRRSGNTWARVEGVSVDFAEDFFIPLKEINALRNRAIEELEKVKLEVHTEPEQPYEAELEPVQAPASFMEIMRPEQNVESSLIRVSQFPLPGVRHKGNLREAKGWVGAHFGDYALLDGLNITNSYALAALLELGYQGAVLSSELSEQGRRDLLQAFKARYGFDAPVIQTVYEKPRLMIMNHCPVNTLLKDGKRQNCSLCRTGRYELEGKDGRKCSLYGTPQCNMQLFDEQALDTIDSIDAYRKEGIRSFRLVFSDETRPEVEDVLARWQQAAKRPG